MQTISVKILTTKHIYSVFTINCSHNVDNPAHNQRLHHLAAVIGMLQNTKRIEIHSFKILFKGKNFLILQIRDRLHICLHSFLNVLTLHPVTPIIGHKHYNEVVKKLKLKQLTVGKQNKWLDGTTNNG